MSESRAQRRHSPDAHPTGLGPSRWILALVVSSVTVSAIYLLVAGLYSGNRIEAVDRGFREASPQLSPEAVKDLQRAYPRVTNTAQTRFDPLGVLEVNDAGRALANAIEERIRESRKAERRETEAAERKRIDSERLAQAPGGAAPASPTAAPEPASPEGRSGSLQPLTEEQRDRLSGVAALVTPGLGAKFFGPEQIVMYIMAALAMFLLVEQLLEIRRQRRQLAEDAAVFSGAKLIHPAEAGLVITRLQQGETRRNVGRFVAAQLLRRFERTGEIDSAASAGEAAIDLVHTELGARLNLVRFAIWAIPTIGFIGTVRGIGGALAVASSPERLPAVVGFLGVAFDTTMVGLLLCLAVVLVSHELERRTDRFLDELSSGAVGGVQRRLRQGGEPAREPA
jgi:biopolymer transport protein ExbB/TolQ